MINSALDTYFPEGCGVEIIARPGRYYVTSAFTLAASITAKEEIPMEQPGSDGPWGWGPCGTSLPVGPWPLSPSLLPQGKSPAARRASSTTSVMASMEPSAAFCLTAPARSLCCTR